MSAAASFDDLRDLYQEAIMTRSRHPLHQKRLDPYDGLAKGDNPMCGDRVEVRIRLAGDSIAEAAFEARGCAISIASADLMADAVTNRTPAEVHTLADQFRAMIHTGACPDCGPEMDPLRPLVGVHEFKSRLKCATLPWDALLGALKESGHG
jgi:nitrogen fixation NifU-like protein